MLFPAAVLAVGLLVLVVLTLCLSESVGLLGLFDPVRVSYVNVLVPLFKTSDEWSIGSPLYERG